MRAAGSSAMVPLAELQEQAMTLHMEDASGAHTMAIRRFKSGQVGMTCTCGESRAQGWCHHRVDVLCGRFAGLRPWDGEKEQAVRRLAGGTLMADDAIKLDVLLKDFDGSLRAFDAERPANVAGENLSVFTELVSDLAAAAAELEDAVGRLRRRFDVGSSLIRKAAPEVVPAE